MFSWIKNLFTEGVRDITTGENDMSGTARISEDNGKFVLFTRTETIGTYTRRRDAVRGATRRGLTVA